MGALISELVANKEAGKKRRTHNWRHFYNRKSANEWAYCVCVCVWCFANYFFTASMGSGSGNDDGHWVQLFTSSIANILFLSFSFYSYSALEDMKQRLRFLRRRHTDSSLHASTVRPPRNEVEKWSKSFRDLMANRCTYLFFNLFDSFPYFH